MNESELYDVSHSCSPLSKFKYPNISYDDNFCLFITLKSRPFLETIVIKDYLVYSIFNGGYFFDIGNISWRIEVSRHFKGLGGYLEAKISLYHSC